MEQNQLRAVGSLNGKPQPYEYRQLTYNDAVGLTAAARQALASQALRNVAQKASSEVQTHQLTDQASFGGRYSGSGLELADKNSELNAIDMANARKLVGIGGSMIGEM